MKKQSQLQKLASLTKIAVAPSMTLPAIGFPGSQPHEQGGKYGQENVKRVNNMIGIGSGGSNRPVPAKQPSQFNINVANRSQAGNFSYDNLIKPTTRRYLNQQQPSREQIAYQNKLKYRPYRRGGGYSSSQQTYPYQPSNTQQQQPYQPPQQHYTVGQYIRKYPPTPAGVPYRRVRPIYDSDGFQDNINAYTDVLNDSGLYHKELSSLDSDAAERLSKDISPNDTVYQVDARDAANWMYSRRGLDLTDAQWARMNAARQSQNSQLNPMPQAIYYAWSNNNGDSGGYSLSFNGDSDKNNQFFNVFNSNRFDQPYFLSEYNGYGLGQQHDQLLEPWQRLMHFQDVQDHELSHSFNDIPDSKWIGPWDLGMDFGNKSDLFFRTTNNPEQPYYDNDTTEYRKDKFDRIFQDTYLSETSEYIGAMGRVKRYGAELGYDTTSSDPTTARIAMAHTLHYFANHPNPEELTPEQQRLHSWLNTAAMNHMRAYSDDYKTGREAIKGNSEEELRQRAIQRQQFNQNLYTDYIKDPESQFYMDVLDFMTDSTIQGLVRNDVPNNNTSALNNLRPIYA